MEHEQLRKEFWGQAYLVARVLNGVNAVGFANSSLEQFDERFPQEGTGLQPGDIVEVIKNSTNHGFEIGSTIILVKKDFNLWWSTDDRVRWCISEQDIKKL